MKSAKKSRLHLEKKNKMMHYSSKLNSSIDLSDFEEAADRSFFLKVGQDAAKNAVNENKAMRLPITFFLDGWIVQRLPNGDIQKVVEVKTSNRTKNRRLAKGTILHVKRTAL